MDTLCKRYNGGKEKIKKKFIYIKFYLKDVIDEKLDSRLFPSIGGLRSSGTSYTAQRY
jgi:hypothetical protein